MTVTPSKPEMKKEYTFIWEKLPPNFPLPDDPVDNIIQPELAIALKESLVVAELTTQSMLIASNFGVCVVVNDKTVVKAPDWLYIPNVLPSDEGEVRRSYTPYIEGDIPTIVMEFLSDTEGGEYSIKATYPYGKWWFYERILQVPVYVIFDPASGTLEVYHLTSGVYEQHAPNSENLYWIAQLRLYLGVWRGTRSNIHTYWLRWWDADGNMLLWVNERVELANEEVRLAQLQASWVTEQMRATEEQLLLAQQQIEQERNRAEILAQRLRSLGINPDNLV